MDEPPEYSHPMTGGISEDMGFLFGTRWIPVEEVVGWAMQHHDMGWLSTIDLIQTAAALYGAQIGENGVFMGRDEVPHRQPRETIAQARRWKEWGPQARNTTAGVNSGTTAASSSSSSSSHPGHPSASAGVIPGNAVSTSASSSSQGHYGTSSASLSMKGFYRHGQFVPRDRTAEEQRRHAGGQGPARMARRQARLEAWTTGQWIPAWLRDYQVAKQARDQERRQGHYKDEQVEEKQAEKKENQEDMDNEGDNTELLQHPRGGEHGVGQLWRPLGPPVQQNWRTFTDTEFDEVNFMMRPGLKGEEKALLQQEGVAAEHVAEMEFFFREYESYVGNDLGAEARWALGVWLLQSQEGAGVQDNSEAGGSGSDTHVLPPSQRTTRSKIKGGAT
ncbi:unnamed protein product [Symbiodinium sp. CCMP2456]|nr:unnamed protein product [Symbiodinium sp. CCMP2456]